MQSARCANAAWRSTPFTDKMPKRLMLGSHPRRGRHRRDRLDALALTSQHQSLCPITLANPSTYAANRDSLLLNLGDPSSASILLT